MGCRNLDIQYYFRLTPTTGDSDTSVYTFSGTYSNPCKGSKPVIPVSIPGYRYYDATMGRWINRDPIEESGGANVYAMVWNDPIKYWDVLGMISRTSPQYDDSNDIFVTTKYGPWASVEFKSDSGEEGCWEVEGDGSAFGGPSAEIDGSDFGKTVKIKPTFHSMQEGDTHIIFNKDSSGVGRAPEESLWISVRRPKYIKVKNIKRTEYITKGTAQKIGYKFRYYFYDQFSTSIPAGIQVHEDVDELEHLDVGVEWSNLGQGDAPTQKGGWVQDTWSARFTIAVTNGVDAAGQVLTIGDYKGIVIHRMNYDSQAGSSFDAQTNATMY